MAAIIKTTFTFDGQAQGWSESFYWLSTDGNLQTAETLVTPLAQKRAACLASGYTLRVGRNEQVQNPVGTKVLRVSDLFEPGYLGNPAWGPATPNLALLLTWQNAANTQSKKQYMRGIPGDLGDNGKIANFGNPSIPGYYTALASWASAMQNFQAGWLATAVTFRATITGYVVDPVTAQVTFTIVPGIGWTYPVPQGQPFRVYINLPNKNPLDGPMTVIQGAVANTVFTAGAHPAAPLPTGQVGTMTQRAASLVQLTPIAQGGAVNGIQPQRIISHKTGRPLYASRGRRAVTTKW